MGYRIPTASATVINNASSLAAETILFTTGAIVQQADSALVIILWYLTLTIGTAGTAVTLRIRRGPTITGAVLNTATALTVVAGNSVLLSGAFADSVQGQGPNQYSLTTQVTAATANSALGDASMIAMSL